MCRIAKNAGVSAERSKPLLRSRTSKRSADTLPQSGQNVALQTPFAQLRERDRRTSNMPSAPSASHAAEDVVRVPATRQPQPLSESERIGLSPPCAPPPRPKRPPLVVPG